MKHKRSLRVAFTVISLLVLLGFMAQPAAAADVVVPASFAAVEGNYGLNTPVRDQPRTLQIAYSPAALTDLIPGMPITGMTFRVDGGDSSWPLSDATWADYTIKLSTSLNPPEALDATFANNIGPDVVTVYSGTLTIPANAFPGGATPNAFGQYITFATPYVYTGGNLLITLTHTGNNIGSAQYMDIDDSNLSLMNGQYATSYNATTADLTNQGGLIIQLDMMEEPDLVITKTESSDPVAVGEPLTYTLVVTNTGIVTATGIIVTDTLPAGVTFVSATPSQGSCSESGGVVTCYLHLLANPGAETGNLSGWMILQNNGNGWATTTDTPHMGSRSFVTSYGWDTRYQEVDLLAEGYSAAYLDSAPEVDAGEWIRGFNCGGGCNPADTYYIHVELRDASHAPIASWDTGMQTATSIWTEYAHTFSGYGSGLRYIYFEDGGRDVEYWWGNYGAQMDDAYATVGEQPLLAPGETYTVTILVNVDAGGILTNTAGVALDQTDANPTDNTVTITTTAYAPPIANNDPGLNPVFLFYDGFEGGYGNWTMDGLWNPENEADTCGGLVAPFPSPTNDAYYGQDGICNYNVGNNNTGSLTLTAPIYLPPGSLPILEFSSWEQTFNICGLLDRRYVELSTDGGGSWITLGELCTENTWYQPSYDLSAYAGQSILLRFRFDTVIYLGIGSFGWMVDDISVFDLSNWVPVPGFATDEDTAFTTSNVLDNDSDPYGFPLLVDSFDTSATLGLVTYNGDGTFIYDPNGQFEWLEAGEIVTDTFTYVVSNGYLTDTASVYITIGGINDAPVADDQAIDTDEDIPYVGLLTATDAESDPLSFVLDVAPANGTVDVAADGIFTYTPTLNYNGADLFTFIVSDGVLTDTGQVDIIVNPVNDNPMVEAGDDFTAAEGSPAYFSGSFTDPGQLLAGEMIQWNFGDGWTITGTLTPTHTYADNGVYTVTLTITDELGGVGSDWLLVTVDNVAPVLSPVSNQNVRAGTPLTITAAFTDPGWLDTHTVVIAWGDGVTKTVDLDAGVLGLDLSHTYASDGTFTATLSVTDDDGGLHSLTFVVNVTPSSYMMSIPLVFK
jgi:uncharacterized repeat protein (TIGR01451 family)